MSSDSSKNQNTAPQYADEVLCANWSPLARMLAEPSAQPQTSVPEGLDVEAFLARLYRSQQA
jgi:hypothetical protein